MSERGFDRLVTEGIARAKRARRSVNPRRKSTAPWREVVWIGVSPEGPQGGQVWTLVTACGHITHRPYPKPQPHKIFRAMPMAPHRVRCLSCEIGAEPADPQDWIDILTKRGYAP